MGMTQQYYHIIFTSCTILQCMPKSSLQVHCPIHITTHQDTQPCSLHSLPHTTICAMFSSNKPLILQHAIQTQHCSCIHSYCIQDRPHLPCSVVNHNMTSPCTLTCTTLSCSTTHPTAFHNPPITRLTSTRHSW